MIKKSSLLVIFFLFSSASASDQEKQNKIETDSITVEETLNQDVSTDSSTREEPPEVIEIESDESAPSENVIESEEIAETPTDEVEEEVIEETPVTPADIEKQNRKIRSIKLVRRNKNKYLTNDAIINRVPFKVGETFSPIKTNLVIKNLYDLDYFDQIKVTGSLVGDDEIDLFVILDEQKELLDIILIGNKHVTIKEIEDDAHISELKAINQRKVDWLVKKIKNLYRKKDYHMVDIISKIEMEDGKAIVTIDIQENRPVHVKRVIFKGNEKVSDKKIRDFIQTKEDWIFSFLNKAGSYQEENIEVDKRIIEQVYKTYGYINAKVTDSKVEQDPCDNEFIVTFTIKEGEKFKISEITVDGKEILNEDYLLAILPIQPKQIYSHRAMFDAIELLKDTWGDHGFIFADVQPNIEPNVEDNTVKIHFNTDLGNKVFLNRVSISGNLKTRDYVLRRKLASLCEGDLITKTKMDRAKDTIEGLGYFVLPDGVNWKTTKVSDDKADLELIVKEQKTGKASVQVGYGASPPKGGNPTPTGGFNIGGFIQETNLCGWGMTVNTGANLSKEQLSFNASIINPYFRQKPIYTEFDAGYTITDWTQDLSSIEAFNEKNFNLGFFTGLIVRALPDTLFRCGFSYNHISYSKDPKVRPHDFAPAKNLETFQQVVNRLFPRGNILTIEPSMNQNLKNHTMHPTRGHQWSIVSKLGWSDSTSSRQADTEKIGYVKVEGDFSWYTPLIGEKTLIFGFHCHAGRIFTLENRNIPFDDVFHVGGPMSVRGFDYGQISPTIMIGNMRNPIGAKKSVVVNFELIFPITADFSMKGRLFYDGGAGWDAPGTHGINCTDLEPILRNNSFHYRHSIGFGISMLQPQPMKIDFGLKLDKQKGESEWEVHFSAYQEF
ncbi:outer membrane protein assembly factor BamA [bacterium]|jgi:outer membrane protein insertion porin family|nr:outer membrane protein assembly factor BamA [bacterium]MBT5015785.1 outer membrane protein assembly factor BamA [bacterium]